MPVSRPILTALCLAAAFAGPAARADQVIADDLIVQRNLCVGGGCADGEGFPYGVLKVTGNTVRMHFEDTSLSTVPDRDWSLVINDSATTGMERFSVQDIDAGTLPFTIEGGIAENTLYLAPAGRVGMGTGLPQRSLHIMSDENFPGLRLERTSASFFGPDTWDINMGAAGGLSFDKEGSYIVYFSENNETALFVLDDNAAGIGAFQPKAKLHVNVPYDDLHTPFGLFVSDLGSATPDTMAHIKSAYGNALLKIENTSNPTTPRTMLHLVNRGRPEILMTNSSTAGEWSFGAGTNFFLRQGPAGSTNAEKTKLLAIQEDGDMILLGSLTTGGTTCGGGCDRVFAEDYDLPSIEDHAEAMFALGHLPNVGPTLEGAPINVSDKVGRMLNELEHAHIYIADLSAENRALRAELAQVRRETRARLDRLEAALD